jgi:hypothetical protein
VCPIFSATPVSFESAPVSFESAPVSFESAPVSFEAAPVLSVPSDEEIAALVGHRFAGGVRKVEHWENWLLTDCTQRPPMSGGHLHPVVLFHVPIQAASTSIGEIFALCGGGPAGSVTLLSYEWEFLAAISEDVVYRGDGGIVSAERFRNGDGQVTHDDIAFVIELTDPDATIVARVTTRWRFLR